MAQWVRLEVQHGQDRPVIVRRTFPVVGTTAKGAWLMVSGRRKWVHAGEQNAYASPSDEIALARLRVQQDARRVAAGDEHHQSLVVDALARIACGMAAESEPEEPTGGVVMHLTEDGWAYVMEAVATSLGVMDAGAAIS